jgi:hypothetical protein
MLDCLNNKLIYLPPLNFNLISLNCSNNQLTSLPNLNRLIYLHCENNHIYLICKIKGIIRISDKDNIKKWNHFREFYFLSKLKKKLISWMWKSREKQIRQLFHPSHLIQFLENNHVSDDDNSSLDIFLNHWN